MHTILIYCVVRISNTYSNMVPFVCRESLDRRSQQFWLHSTLILFILLIQFIC